ncbi:MAG: 50S ribosomal protein L29 [Candidatus Aenigmatarchaeota archaeon]
MAVLKMKKIRELPENELNEKLHELKLELSKERAFSEIGTVKNPGRIREIRRTIARIQTHKNAKKPEKKKSTKK